VDLIRAMVEVDNEIDAHAARILVLIATFSDPGKGTRLEGLTKLAKLDFLLRYPTMLEKALRAKQKPAEGVQVQDYERRCVESRMVRYRFGPWDHNYGKIVNVLLARRLIDAKLEGRTVTL
jgi:hypothetical protein